MLAGSGRGARCSPHKLPVAALLRARPKRSSEGVEVHVGGGMRPTVSLLSVSVPSVGHHKQATPQERGEEAEGNQKKKAAKTPHPKTQKPKAPKEK